MTLTVDRMTPELVLGAMYMDERVNTAIAQTGPKFDRLAAEEFNDAVRFARMGNSAGAIHFGVQVWRRVYGWESV